MQKNRSERRRRADPLSALAQRVTRKQVEPIKDKLSRSKTNDQRNLRTGFLLKRSNNTAFQNSIYLDKYNSVMYQKLLSYMI